MALRLTSRGRAHGASLRGSGALLAVAVTAGLTSQVTPAVAQDSTGSGSEDYLAGLVGSVSDTQEQITSLETELGGLRESVNKSRVDFDRSTREAVDAQDAVTQARSRLGGSQEELETAQSGLDEIARAAYTRGGDASPVPLASGSSADDAVDRATFIRLAQEKQQAEIDRLDLARTQAANEDARLREARNTADATVAAAQEARNRAQEQMEQVARQLSEKAEAHRKLLEAAEEARERLAAARAAVDRIVARDPGASSFDKRRAAEAAADSVAVPDSSGSAGDDGLKDAKVSTTTSAPTSATTSAPTSTTEATTEESSPSTTPAAESTTTGEPVETSAPTGSTDGSTDTSFEDSEEGDTRRQAAIDGLVDAAGAALVSGVDAASSGRNPVSAAGNAARDSASRSYAALTGGQGGSGEGEDTGTGDVTTPDDSTGDETDSSGTDDGSIPDDTTDDGTGTDDAVVPGGGTNQGDSSSPDTSGTTAEQIEQVIARGMTQLGVTYAWGGGNWYGPTLGIRDGGVADSYGDYNKVGFDCSGLMMYAFYAVGIQLEHYSGYQYTSGTQVPVDQAKRGDMLFWGPGGSSHVALYLGDGKMLEAPQSGSVVQVSDVRWSGIEPYATRMIE
ncbi:DIP1281 family NlpC/P60 protein [Corynebacterium provencense]|uniref:DIP1281 family NlpC/P60 protein n=1 Tax=Corynebacterium provencense TaxID=1737425 RepID=UPI000A5E733E|nr:NlpC/P60 family protein [Corynebacterium provencense]